MIYFYQHIDGLALNVEIGIGQYCRDFFYVDLVAALGQSCERCTTDHVIRIAELHFQGVRNLDLVEFR